jgi:hypothetical protein
MTLVDLKMKKMRIQPTLIKMRMKMSNENSLGEDDVFK